MHKKCNVPWPISWSMTVKSVEKKNRIKQGPKFTANLEIVKAQTPQPTKISKTRDNVRCVKK